ncbi:hypothetical protein KW786_02965 [Candidatus Parcubacteria bacterium]|nr:hypothetical protein [Candidatus Parcubacteria bacterium]
MISWLFIIIAAYFFFSLAFFADKLVLSGPPNPKLYTFYVSFLGVTALLVIPFLKFTLPGPLTLLYIGLEVVIYVAGLYVMFLALSKFEVSRVMTAIGALQPILILVFTLIFWSQNALSGSNLIAFFLLVAGGILISMGEKFKITKQYALLILLASLLFSLDYIFSKLIFLNVPFLQAMVWMRVGAALVSLFLLFDRKLRKDIFTKKPSMGKKTGLIFLFGQSAGGTAGFLQSLAISMVPISYLAITSSLRGIQYIFLFIITLFFSWFFPKFFKENISGKVILQKAVSIVLIVIGLALLV